MALLIKNAHVYAPQDLGTCDVLIVNKQIAAVGKDLTVTMPGLETLDAKGLIMTPGFIDQHIHVTGGGGEGGPKTRTPELVLSELIACGTTSVVGVSGTDGSSRSIPNLLGKVRALQAEGVSAWMYTSNYAYPPTTLTSCVRDDLYFVPEVLGVKIAMGDHRDLHSFPTRRSSDLLYPVPVLKAVQSDGGVVVGKVQIQIGGVELLIGIICTVIAIYLIIVFRMLMITIILICFGIFY